MSDRPASLSVHKNTVERRRKRELAKSLSKAVEQLTRESDLRAYAIVGIGADGNAFALWDTGAILPQWAFADTVAHVLREVIRSCGIADDWRPSLTVKGSTSQ